MKKILEIILLVLVFIVLNLVCFLPAGIFLLSYIFLNPQGFWQQFVLYGVGIWLLGGLQFVGLICFVVLWIKVILIKWG